MDKMTPDRLRKLYLDFFKAKGHAVISGSSLIPDNDPTVLFTTAGMHPLVPYILGQEHPQGKRLADFQKCARTGDIDSVGDASHLTFFEMLGNWSLGDYFKKEMIAYSFEFLTKVLKISPDKLFVTVFEGDADAPRDEEAAALWRENGLDPSHIFFLPKKDNWWGPAGATGPCGPDSEMFFDTGKDKCSDACRPGCGCGKYLEIWNDVFMQYKKTEDGRIVEMERKCIDTGMGIERAVCVLNGQSSVYDIEPFQRIMAGIEALCARKIPDDGPDAVSARIISDHIRTAVFMTGDQNGIAASNIGQGYVLRRLIRRTVRHGRKLGIKGLFLGELARIVIELYKDAYPELEENRAFTLSELQKEEEKFGKTIDNGEKEFEKVMAALGQSGSKEISGRIAFKLYDTFGFPIELTEELAAERGVGVDKEGFAKAFEKHQSVSRANIGSFKSGLADHSEKTVAYHTATHLLHKALCVVTGGYVKQLGSNITAERLRFDFNHDGPLTADEIRQTEDLVNAKIAEGLEVTRKDETIEEARAEGAFAQFDAKYSQLVSVYSIGDFSKEVCAGPHVANTSQLGHFRIVKESSSSAGVRRIRAVLE